MENKAINETKIKLNADSGQWTALEKYRCAVPFFFSEKKKFNLKLVTNYIIFGVMYLTKHQVIVNGSELSRK